MIREVIDKESGAILFKQDEDTENLYKEIDSLKKMIAKLEKRIKTLEGK